MADRIRTTISLDPDVHAIFVTMAQAAGTSVSRCMGDWLADTAEGAQFVASKMQEARRAPKTVMRELQATAQGLVDALDEQAEVLRRVRADSRMRPAAPGGSTGTAQKPPSSPTGVKSPEKGKSQGRKAA